MHYQRRRPAHHRHYPPLTIGRRIVSKRVRMMAGAVFALGGLLWGTRGIVAQRDLSKVPSFGEILSIYASEQAKPGDDPSRHKATLEAVDDFVTAQEESGETLTATGLKYEILFQPAGSAFLNWPLHSGEARAWIDDHRNAWQAGWVAVRLAAQECAGASASLYAHPPRINTAERDFRDAIDLALVALDRLRIAPEDTWALLMERCGIAPLSALRAEGNLGIGLCKYGLGDRDEVIGFVEAAMAEHPQDSKLNDAAAELTKWVTQGGGPPDIHTVR